MANPLKVNQSVPSKPRKQNFTQAYWRKSIQPTDNLFGNISQIQVHGEQQYLDSQVSLAEGVQESH